MFYDSSGDRVPGLRVLQHVDVPWTAPGSSECEFRKLRSYPREAFQLLN